jgi:hypothetical protein
MEQALEYTRHTSAPGYALKPFGLLADLFKFNSGSLTMSFRTLSTAVSALTSVRYPELIQFAYIQTILFNLHGSSPPQPPNEITNTPVYSENSVTFKEISSNHFNYERCCLTVCDTTVFL